MDGAGSEGIVCDSGGGRTCVFAGDVAGGDSGVIVMEKCIDGGNAEYRDGVVSVRSVLDG